MLNFVIEDNTELWRIQRSSLVELLSLNDIPHWIYRLSKLKEPAFFLINEGDIKIWDFLGARFSLGNLSIPLLAAIREGRVKIICEISSNPWGLQVSGMMDIIEKEFANRKIPISQLVVVTCNLSEKDAYQSAQPNGTVPIFNLGVFAEYTAHDLRKHAKEFPDRVVLDTLNEHPRPHKFVYLNGSNHNYRVAMVVKLMSLGITDQGLFSYSNNTDQARIPPDQYNHLLHGSVDLWWPNDPDYQRLHDTADELAMMGPIRVDDMKWEDGQNALYLTSSNYSDSYFSIVSETLFVEEVYRATLFTEKITRPVAQYQPFVVLGQQGILAEAHKRGMQSFQPYIDESYDSEPDDHKRMAMVVAEIQRLCSMSLEELHEWYHGPLKQIVIQNYDHLMDTSVGPVHDLAENLKKVLNPPPLNLWFDYITPEVPIPNGVYPSTVDSPISVAPDIDEGIIFPWKAPLIWGVPHIYFIGKSYGTPYEVRPIAGFKEGDTGFCWIAIEGGFDGLVSKNRSDFVSRLSWPMLEKIREGDIKLVLDTSVEGQFWTKTLVYQFVSLMGSYDIPLKNIIMLSGNLKNTSTSYDEWCDETDNPRDLKFIPFAMFESAMHSLHLPETNPPEQRPRDIRPHKFLCLNRVPYIHRSALVLALMEMGELDDNLISYPNQYVVDDRPVTSAMLADAVDKFWPDAQESEHLKKWIPKLLAHRSLVVDSEELTGELALTAPVDMYKSSYFSIVTESLFDDMSLQITEKIWKPIFNFHPYINIGNTGTLEHIRSLGYQTFSPWIDETYDTIADNRLRFQTTLTEIRRLCKMTMEEMHEWYWGMSSVLEHNQNLFFKRHPGEFERLINLFRQEQ